MKKGGGREREIFSREAIDGRTTHVREEKDKLLSWSREKEEDAEEDEKEGDREYERFTAGSVLHK